MCVFAVLGVKLFIYHVRLTLSSHVDLREFCFQFPLCRNHPSCQMTNAIASYFDGIPVVRRGFQSIQLTSRVSYCNNVELIKCIWIFWAYEKRWVRKVFLYPHSTPIAKVPYILYTIAYWKLSFYIEIRRMWNYPDRLSQSQATISWKFIEENTGIDMLVWTSYAQNMSEFTKFYSFPLQFSK